MSKPKKSGERTAKRLLKLIIGPHKLLFTFVMVCVLTSAAASTVGALFLRKLIDDYIAPLLTMSNPVFDDLIRALGVMAVIYLTGVLTTYIFNRCMAYIGQDVQRKLRDDMFSHMQTLPISYFDRNSYGDIMSRYTNDIDTLRQMISQSIPQILSALVTVVCVFAVMVFTSLPLTGVVLFISAIDIVVIRTISGRSKKNFREQQMTLGKVNGYIEEMMNGQKVVKVFGREEESQAAFDGLSEELFVCADRANKYANILMPILGNLGHLQYAVLAIVGGALSTTGVIGLSLGTIASFLQLGRSFSNPINQVAQQINFVIMALAGAQRIFVLMDEESEQDEGYVTLVNAKIEDGNITETEERTGLWAWRHPHGDGTLTYTPLKGDIVLEDVDFSYVEGKQVLRQVSIFARPGEKVALVGATGAGKTTITNLINRFYDIQQGKIRYDGINIGKIKKSDLRRSLAVVLQDTNLFTGTVLENIRYGRPEATDEEVYAAAERVSAHKFIRHLPEGYNTVIEGNGEGLSQGQRQMLSIARAAVADPPVMILDEATSSIDTRTEMLVQSGMDALMKGRTVFVIAHRLSTIQNADVIMVMEGGEIIERGNHQKLLEDKGKYYQLYMGVKG